MKKDLDQKFTSGASLPELSAEDQAFIRLLREQAEDTPVPMALQPEMILARLPDKPAKRRFSWLRIPSIRQVLQLQPMQLQFQQAPCSALRTPHR
mgnify:CR=1 FL=1